MTDADRTADWPPILDSLIAGVAHHISNRVAVLSGISEIFAASTTIPAPVLQAFASEVPKLEEAIRLLRLLPNIDEPPEAIEPGRLIHDALALVALHPRLKELACTAAIAAEIPPVLARPTALTHEIIIAIVHAARESTTGSVLVQLEADAHRVVITAGRYSVPAQTLSSARQAEAQATPS